MTEISISAIIPVKIVYVHKQLQENIPLFLAPLVDDFPGELFMFMFVFSWVVFEQIVNQMPELEKTKKRLSRKRVAHAILGQQSQAGKLGFRRKKNLELFTGS